MSLLLPERIIPFQSLEYLSTVVNIIPCCNIQQVEKERNQLPGIV
jgi:hypothetical protein